MTTALLDRSPPTLIRYHTLLRNLVAKDVSVKYHGSLLGVGFHPDLSGRENVYLNTSLYGLSRRQTDDIYDAIVDFSELAEFMDLPVKNYSSGMDAGLGFSIAAHLQADVLLVDEILAAGDEHFRQKYLARMEDVRRRDTTAVLVSHDLATAPISWSMAASTSMPSRARSWPAVASSSREHTRA